MNKFLKQLYIEILQEGSKNINEDYKLACKVFGEKRGIKISRTLTHFQYKNVIYNLNNFFKDFEIDFFSYTETLPQAIQFSVDVDKHEFRYNQDGLYFLVNKQDPNCIFLLRLLEGGYYDKPKVQIITNKENLDKINNYLTKLIDYGDNNSYYKNKVINLNLEFLKLDKKYTWDDIILTKKEKEDIQKDLIMLFSKSELFCKYNFSKGILLHGEPGTGKTMLAKVLASQAKDNYTFIWITPEELHKFSPSYIYDIARSLKPTIVFFEDLDLFGQTRKESAYKEVLGQLLNELSGLKDNSHIVTIATTNDLKSIEKALKDRPGRFDIVYEFNLPKIPQRYDMLTLFSKDLKIEVDLKEISKKLEDLTGAHIRELINQVIYLSIMNEDKKVTIKEKYIQIALKRIKKVKIEPVIGFNQAIKTEDKYMDDYEDEEDEL